MKKHLFIIKFVGILSLFVTFIASQNMEAKGSKAEAKHREKATTSASDIRQTTHNKVDLNTASEAEIEALPGIGKETAAAIVRARPFKSYDDLKNVKGLGEKKLSKIRSQTTLSANSLASQPSKATEDRTSSARQSNRQTENQVDRVPKKSAENANLGRTSSVEQRINKDLAPEEAVNLNTSSVAELKRLPGIGDVKAQAIVDARPFSRIEDVMKVKGIKEGTFTKIKDHITVK